MTGGVRTSRTGRLRVLAEMSAMKPIVDPVNLPAWGQFAVYRGKEYPYSASSREAVWLRMDRADFDQFPADDVLEWGDPQSRGLGVLVPASTISRFFSRGMSARWFGEPVGFSVVDTETVEIYYDRDPRLAELMGLKGNQYDGFRAHVPFAELQDIEVIVTPHPVYDWWGTDFPDGPPAGAR